MQAMPDVYLGELEQIVLLAVLRLGDEAYAAPILEQIATEKGLHLVFNAGQSGLSWAAPGLDLTQEVIKKLDGAKAPAASPKP